MNKPRRRKKKDNTKQITIVALFIIIVVLLIIALTSKSKAPNESAPAESSATTSYTQSTASENSDSESSQTVSDTASEPEISEPEASEPEESKSFDYSIDITPYEEYIDPVNSDQFLILVNSENTITSDYVPADLVTTVNAKSGAESPKFNATADKALTALLKEAAANGYTRIRMSSGYRSYATQSWWFYEVYMKNERSEHPNLSEQELENLVMKYSAKPGTSEHQTGLALDMYDTDDNSTFAGTPSANWLAENAHKFGFILRYPKGKESITGIMYESWHFRFVGRTVATEIYENGWTLEEYLEANN